MFLSFGTWQNLVSCYFCVLNKRGFTGLTDVCWILYCTNVRPELFKGEGGGVTSFKWGNLRSRNTCHTSWVFSVNSDTTNQKGLLIIDMASKLISLYDIITCITPAGVTQKPPKPYWARSVFFTSQMCFFYGLVSRVCYTKMIEP